MPEDIEFVLDRAYAAPGDGTGALFMGTVLVRGPSDVEFEGSDGTPLPGVRVDLLSGWSGAYLIPEGAVKIVADLDEACESSDDEACQAWYDTEGARSFELAGEYEAVEGIRPTYYQAVTDDRGIVEFYVFLDSAPSNTEGEAAGFSVYASIQVATESFAFTPAGN